MTNFAELYVALFAGEFSAQALLRLRSDMRGEPCVVLEGDPPLQEVCSLNRRAGSLGLVRGMTKIEVETFPAVKVLLRSSPEEAAARVALLESAGAFSPRVEDRSKNGIFLCGIDIAGTQNLFGPPECLAQNLLSRIQALRISACITVSSNFHAAVALAKGSFPPNAIKVIPAGEERAVLAPLPLTVLDLTDDQAETFSLWGIRTLGMLAALPEKELAARMGQSGQRLRQLARGEMPHLFQPTDLPFTLEEHMELDSPVELLYSLLFVVNAMLDQLILRAQARLLTLASVNVTLTLDGGKMHACTVRPALPSNDKQLWIKLLHLDLEAHPPNSAIHALKVVAEPGDTSKIQLGLFSPQLPEPARLDVTLARIRAIVGDDCVGRAVLKDTHQPQGFNIEPFSVPSNSATVNTARQFRAALRKLRPVENISVTVQDQRPKSFFFREKRYVVEHIYGPWLSSGDWWNPTLWGIEQWDVEARAQDNVLLHCCLVRDKIADRWQMTALYD